MNKYKPPYGSLQDSKEKKDFLFHIGPHIIQLFIILLALLVVFIFIALRDIFNIDLFENKIILPITIILALVIAYTGKMVFSKRNKRRQEAKLKKAKEPWEL